MFGINFNRPESVFYENYRRQLTATLTINIISLSHGIGLGWASPMLFKLQSNNSPLTFDISVQEASWIGSLVAVGGVSGNFIFGFLIDLIGRKKCIYMLALPHITFWTLIYFANDVFYLYVARVLAGITGGGLYIVIPIFVAEIADPQIRGTLGSLFCFSLNIGILSGFIVASHIPYLVIPIAVAVLPLLYLTIATQYPETPQYLLRKGLTDGAEKSLKFYKNHKPNKNQEEKFVSDFVYLKMSVNSSKNKQKVTFKDFGSVKVIKALISGVVLVFVNTFTGIFTILSYSSMIFAETHSSIDPNTNTIIIGIVQIIGSYCATILVDKHGRKILLLLSTSGMCLGFITIGVYSYLLKQMDLSSLTWLPVVSLSFVIFTANIGIVAVTFVVLVEILPPKIRSMGSTFCLVLLSLFGFTVLKIFPILMATIGLSGVMGMFAGVAAFGFLYISIFLSETKGKSLDIDT